MGEKRLGDVIDDFCVKCRRLTNHSIVSLFDGEAAKVRCRTCYHDHDYRHEQAPPTKKELKKAEEDAKAALALQNGEAEDVPGLDAIVLDDEFGELAGPDTQTEEIAAEITEETAEKISQDTPQTKTGRA